jgi:hypothetical protein
MHNPAILADFVRPYVGLRAFRYVDREHFFGRDHELNVLECGLKQNRFVAVVGRKGSGKSSLISAGLRPRLEKAVHHPWHWIEVLPSTAPIRGLALGLAALTGKAGNRLEASADRFELGLTRSSFGLVEALQSIPTLQKLEHGKVLLFVDQFEELFSLGAKASLPPWAAAERGDEAMQFVRLLLSAAKSPLLPVHVIVSIRSEFIGDCGRFHGLPEAVSRAQFLVPDMTRDQRELVIRKSVQLAGGQIDAALVQRALNSTNEDPNQLPNLQRALMRYWKQAPGGGNQVGNCRPVIEDTNPVAGS